MTVTPTVAYRCSLCKREFISFAAAKKCEANHLKPTSVKAVNYSVQALFPYVVEVTFKTGEKEIYIAEKMIM